MSYKFLSMALAGVFVVTAAGAACRENAADKGAYRETSPQINRRLNTGPKADRAHLMRGMHPIMPNTSYPCHKSKMKMKAAGKINHRAGEYSGYMDDDMIIIDEGGFIEE